MTVSSEHTVCEHLNEITYNQVRRHLQSLMRAVHNDANIQTMRSLLIEGVALDNTIITDDEKQKAIKHYQSLSEDMVRKEVRQRSNKYDRAAENRVQDQQALYDAVVHAMALKCNQYSNTHSVIKANPITTMSDEEEFKNLFGFLSAPTTKDRLPNNCVRCYEITDSFEFWSVFHHSPPYNKSARSHRVCISRGPFYVYQYLEKRTGSYAVKVDFEIQARNDLTGNMEGFKKHRGTTSYNEKKNKKQKEQKEQQKTKPTGVKKSKKMRTYTSQDRANLNAIGRQIIARNPSIRSDWQAALASFERFARQSPVITVQDDIDDDILDVDIMPHRTAMKVPSPDVIIIDQPSPRASPQRHQAKPQVQQQQVQPPTPAQRQHIQTLAPHTKQQPLPQVQQQQVQAPIQPIVYTIPPQVPSQPFVYSVTGTPMFLPQVPAQQQQQPVVFTSDGLILPGHVPVNQYQQPIVYSISQIPAQQQQAIIARPPQVPAQRAAVITIDDDDDDVIWGPIVPLDLNL